MAHNKIKTNVIRHQMFGADPWCGCCNNVPENVMHVLRDCPCAMRVWNFFVQGHDRCRFYTLQREEWINANLGGEFLCPQTENWAMLWGVIVWVLWKWRNASIFSTDFLVPTRPDLFVLKYVHHIQHAMRMQQPIVGKMKTRIQIAWEFPEPEYVKLNSDGMVRRNNTEAGCGAVIRDSKGGWIIGCTRSLGVCTTFKAEIWGILDGMRLAKKMNFSKVIVECDSMAAVQIIKSNNNGGDGTTGMIGVIRNMLKEEWDVQIIHAYREANRCADWLGEWSLEHGFGYKEWCQTPSGIQNLLVSDAMGDTYPT